jgi:hypothetical protein
MQEIVLRRHWRGMRHWRENTDHGPDTHFTVDHVDQSESRILQSHIIIVLSEAYSYQCKTSRTLCIRSTTKPLFIYPLISYLKIK